MSESSQNHIHYQITVGLRFRQIDVLELKRLAKNLNFVHELGDENVFTRAANAAMADEPLVVQCMTKHELEETVAAFMRHAIPVKIEPMRLDVPYGSLDRRFKEGARA